MIATEPIPKGCEVVNCYGQLSNAELLRGYGYVEAHNTLQHVQVPTHFCIKAAAAARADSTAAAATGPAAGKGRKKQPAAAAAGEESGSGDDAPPSESEEGAGSEEGEGSEKSEDHASSDDEGESSEGSEPDWDLEDDSPEVLQQQQQRQQQYWAQLQQQQQGADATEGPARKKPKRQQKQAKQQQQQQQVVQPIPSLAEAQQQIPDWEERWQLCFSLGLLPKNGVIQVPAGGLDSCPGQLLAVLLLLLADAADCAALAAASAAASDAAAKAAVAAVAAAAAAAGDGREQAGSKQQQQGSDKANKKQAGGKRGRGSSSSKQDSGPEDPAAAVKEDLAAIQVCEQFERWQGIKQQQPGSQSQPNEIQSSWSCVDNVCNCSVHTVPLRPLLPPVQFTTAARLADALQQLVVLMVSRYPTTLQDDESLLQQLDSLAPRLAAAVTARSGEKQVWAQLQQVRGWRVCLGGWVGRWVSSRGGGLLPGHGLVRLGPVVC
jgi:hypothetical protein